MTVREMIIQLLDFPMDAEVRRSAGEDPMANLRITSVKKERSYNMEGMRTIHEGPVIR